MNNNNNNKMNESVKINNIATQEYIFVHLKSVGDAPALKKNKFKILGTKTVFDIERFIFKMINPTNANNLTSIYLYCDAGFSPTGDQNLQDLYDTFQIDGELIIKYGLQESYG